MCRALQSHYEPIVFVPLDPRLCIARLHRREAQRFGVRILPSGDMATIHAEFSTWAEAYDTAELFCSGLLMHEAWLADQPKPVLRLDQQVLVNDLVGVVLDELSSLR